MSKTKSGLKSTLSENAKKRINILKETNDGFIVSEDKIFLSLNNGRLAIIEILNGNVLDVIKIDNEKISRPYVLNNHMFIVRDNAILKLN